MAGESLASIVEWGPASGDYRASATVAPGVHDFETPPLTPGFRYYFIVRSIDAAGTRSAPSNEVSAVAPASGGAEALVLPRATSGSPSWASANLDVIVDGAGLVASSPAGIDCGARCALDGPAGMPVTLTATPLPGHRFVGWTSGCEGELTCTVRLGGTSAVSARFEPLAAGEEEPSGASRYLAEGASSDFFRTRIALANPSARPATVAIAFQREDASVVPHTVVLPPLASEVVEAGALDALRGHAFSTALESDAPIVVDRTMSWQVPGGQPYGAHAETALASPAPRWYLAEGATHGGFDLFYLLQNPNPFAVQARVRYLRSGAAPLEKTYDLAPTSRRSVWVDLETFGADRAPLLAAAEFSAVIETADGSGIVVERAMYDSRGRTFSAGHGSAGVTAPASRWYFAEGATGTYFDLFLLVANPGAREARLRVTYLLPDGRREVRLHRVAPAQRYTVWVDKEGGALADTAVSMLVESSNDVPVVVERSMWWPGDARTWTESHNAPGATTTGVAWAVADGEVAADGRSRATYLLVANPAATDADVQITLMFPQGAPALSRRVRVAAGSRFGLDVGEAFPEARGQRFGALVESVGGSAPGIVVERAMYSDGPEGMWSAGTSLLATRLR